MRIIGCDLHARQQTLAMLDTVTGEVVNRTRGSFRGSAPAGDGSGLAKSLNKVARCCAFCGARRVFTWYALIRS